MNLEPMAANPILWLGKHCSWLSIMEGTLSANFNGCWTVYDCVELYCKSEQSIFPCQCIIFWSTSSVSDASYCDHLLKTAHQSLVFNSWLALAGHVCVPWALEHGYHKICGNMQQNQNFAHTLWFSLCWSMLTCKTEVGTLTWKWPFLSLSLNTVWCSLDPVKMLCMNAANMQLTVLIVSCSPNDIKASLYDALLQ